MNIGKYGNFCRISLFFSQKSWICQVFVEKVYVQTGKNVI